MTARTDGPPPPARQGSFNVGGHETARQLSSQRRSTARERGRTRCSRDCRGELISGFQGLAQGTLDGGHGVLANFLPYPLATAVGGGAGAFLGASLMHLGERLVDR